jgi:hypothetical protein
LIEMLKETGGDVDAIERVRQAKATIVFKEKAKVAANALPAHLRPGINPFSVLHDMPSEGLHNLNDEECCAIVDQVDAALQFIYVALKLHVEERKAYVEALKGLNKPVKPTP